MDNTIKVRGARQHNLKNVDLDIPKNKLVVFTGVSGSGKSSLAFDTIYAEGQRRYVESLSAYARQFLGVMQKPDVDAIEGLSPAISIDQKTTSHNPRSTVGTVTEIYDYLRLLFARVGHPHCPICGREISSQTLDQIIEAVLSLIEETAKKEKTARFVVLSPVVTDRKGEFSTLFENIKAKGYRRVRVDGVVKDLEDDFLLIKTNKHSIEVIIDRVGVAHKDIKNRVYKDNLKSRLSDSITQALQMSDGMVVVAEIKDKGYEIPDFPKDFEDHLFSEKFACPVDNISLPEIEPRTFSFNSPHGACPKCTGLGKIMVVNRKRVFSDELSIMEGGILPFSAVFEHDTWYSRLLVEVCNQNGINSHTAIKNLGKEEKELLLNGTGDREYRVKGTNRFGRNTTIYETFSGVEKELLKRYQSADSDYIRMGVEKYMKEIICPTCNGSRLKKEAEGITIDGKSISDVTNLSIDDSLEWIKRLSSGSVLSPRESEIGSMVLKEIENRLTFLIDVGLEYLTLARAAYSLAGGEAQRIRLASQIGSGLTGVLYVLDEPTVGLHPRDNDRLIRTLKKLRDLGNSIVVVEHDREMMMDSDHIVDFGPGAGKFGGAVIAQGTPKQVINDKDSVTGKYLSGKRKISSAVMAKKSKNEKLKIYGAQQYNLKKINVEIPLGKLVAVTGVSGSGKSTLVVETIYHAIARELNDYHHEIPGAFSRIEGVENIDRVILIDQSPIGRTPRSNPATYTKTFDAIRQVFAQTKEARLAGFGPGRFSFNVKGGRCEACEGQGQIKIEMQFMPNIWVTCEVCHGKRYNNSTLDVTYKGKNIADILGMTVTEAKEFFHVFRTIEPKLETLEAVGLNYVELGQPATTLSGGEAQRVKLASELAKKATGRTLYILDEPTTGLHFADLERLLHVLKLLVSKGNTVLVIEHNLDIIKNADWVIDLGPEGGEKGGEIVGVGTPNDIAKNKNSYTGQFLRKELE